MKNENTIEDRFLATKIDMKRTVFFITYALDTTSQVDANEINDAHIKDLQHILSNLIKIRQAMDQFIKNNDRIFNIEPS